ncbi:MAG: hypothetical protein HY074_17940, partial [Deltaproteobacteria bacterium]|nr:hypothetical protein [Deltaproteobacteria bacterium]
MIYSFAVFAVAILLQAGLEKAVRAEDGAASFKPLEMPTAASLGFSVAKYRVGEYTGLLTRDLLDARSYVFATNLDGSRSLELVETLGGAAILRVERADGTVTIETFRPGRLRHTEVHRPVGDELEEVESTDWLPEGPRSEKYRLQLAKLRSCASDSVTEEQVNKVLAAYDPKLAGAALRTGTDIIGPFKLSGGCDRFRGGLPNLGKILNNAVSKGMACLAKNSPPVGNHPVRADMARLYTMLASGNKKDAPPTANLVCDANIGTDWAQGL